MGPFLWFRGAGTSAAPGAAQCPAGDRFVTSRVTPDPRQGPQQPQERMPQCPAGDRFVTRRVTPDQAPEPQQLQEQMPQCPAGDRFVSRRVIPANTDKDKFQHTGDYCKEDTARSGQASFVSEVVPSPTVEVAGQVQPSAEGNECRRAAKRETPGPAAAPQHLKLDCNMRTSTCL